MSARYTGGLITKNPPTLNPAQGNAANGVFTMDQYTQAVQAGTWPASDPYFEYTTLLLHGNGTNGAQNNTFLDSSTNNFTITRNGNTTQGTFSPFSKSNGAWGNYFDGSGDYLSSSITAIGTSNFTIEYWSYLTAHSGASGEGGYFQISATAGGLSTSYTNGVIGYRRSTTGNLLINIGGTDITTTHNLVLNTWFHTAIVRSSNSVSVYVNGTLVSTPATISTNLTGTYCAVGGYYNGSYLCTGYISNFRVGNSAVYTSDFTPSTIPLAAISGTSLLTCQSNWFVDNSTNNFVITSSGNVTVTPFSPFPPTSAYSSTVTGGAGYFDGSGDYLVAGTGSAGAPGTGDFCAEAWVYPQNSTDMYIITNLVSSGAGDTQWAIAMNTGSNFIRFQGWSTVYLTTAAPPLNAWCHVAVCRSGTTLSLFVNGTRAATATNSQNFSSTNDIRIGAYASGTAPLLGYISNARFVKGSSVYDPSQTTLTVPTAPLTAIANTSLLTNFTNAGIIDNTMFNALETVGNAQIDTSVVKFGSGSLEFDGSGDSLIMNGGENFAYGTGDFTIEMWFYLNSFAHTYNSLYDARPTSGNGAYVHIAIENNGKIYLFVNSGLVIQSSTSAVSTGQWYHVALARSGTSSKMFLNGSQIGSTYTDTTNYLNPANRPIIANTEAGNASIDGYIDDLRITKGIARYTSNFYPNFVPTNPLPLNTSPSTVLMLPGGGTNGAQNNTFLDSSTNNFTITRNGNTTQGTFAPFSKPAGAWGNFFDGTGDYLSVPDNSAFDLAADFTIEFWMNFAVLPSSAAASMISTYDGGSGGYYIQYRTDLGGRNLRFGSSSTVFIDDTTFNPVVGTWYHIAVVRSGTDVKMYINGVASSSTATTSNSFTSSVPFLIGHLAAGTQPFNGYISNVRVVKGTAVYTTNFTPSASPLTAIANTSLLTCQSNRFVDNSTNGFAITRNGDVKVTTFSPFAAGSQYSATVNGGSGYFDGSGDYLSAANNVALQFSTGDFSFECWIYPTVVNVQQEIISKGTNNAGTFDVGINNSGKLELYTTVIVFSSSASIITNTWQHVALTRSGTTLRLFLNGVLDTTVSSFSTDFNNTATLFIGAFNGSQNYFNGYISNLRLVKGTAVYTSAFTPPTAPVTAIANTSLLCNFTNAGIYDAAMSNDLETVGNAQISTSVTNFGVPSMYFDGTGDYLVAAANTSLALGNGNFTVEMWIYPLSFATYISVWCCANTATSATGFHIGFNASGQMFIYSNSAFRISSSATSGTLNLNQWNNLVVTRNNGIVGFFVNGVQATSTWSTTQDFSQGFNLVGAAPNGGSEYFNGYISDLRITKGVALYPTAPQTSQWQDQ